MGLDREATITRLKDLRGLAATTLENEDADRQATLETIDTELGLIVLALTQTEDVLIDLAFVLELGASTDRQKCPECGKCRLQGCLLHPDADERCEGHETPSENLHDARR